MGSSDSGLMKAVVAASRAASDSSHWGSFLSALCDRFDATAACIHTPRDPVGKWSLFSDVGLPRHTVPDYIEHWSARDPWMAGAASREICVRTGECGIGRELCDWDELERMDYFHEYAAPTGVKGLLAMIVDDGSASSVAPMTVIGLYRRPGLEEFSYQDKRVFESVHAPLQLALHTHWSLRRNLETERISTALVDVNPQPLFVLSQTGELLYANPAGQALLAQGEWIDARTGKLARLGQLEAAEVSASMARAQLGQIQTHSLLRMRTDSLRISATARFVPLGIDNPARWAWPRAATLLTIDLGHDDHQSRRIAQIAMQFKLTAAEARLLNALADGETPGGIAEHQAISVHTVRTHLSNIFGKTGLRRQADLIRLVTQ